MAIDASAALQRILCWAVVRWRSTAQQFMTSDTTCFQLTISAVVNTLTDVARSQTCTPTPHPARCATAIPHP